MCGTNQMDQWICGGASRAWLLFLLFDEPLFLRTINSERITKGVKDQT